MTNARWLAAVAMATGLAALMPEPVPATPVDPEIMAKIGPRVRNPGLSRTQLIEMGRKLFFEETFDGNGRTCGTCHPANNNFTIDPAFIATLPDDDPLFVAEFNPDLEGLEKPELMREHGLILENLDGFDRPGVMRSVPHNLALRTSIEPEVPLPRADGDLVHALGWSGDGSPGDGSLREFSVGAIIQHMPRTLDREEGVDFRLPTAEELDALEAFMLSEGREEDIDLAALNFSDETVRRGKLLFNDEDETPDRRCSGCHSNAGANNSSGNANRDTGVRQITQDLVDDPSSLPLDGGFGTQDLGSGGFGDGTMNTPPLIEAADTPPFFHNNSATTIEAAVAFYTSDDFANSLDGDDRRFQFSTEDINAVGAFLRTLNAMENIRNGNVISMRAQRSVPRLAEREIELVIAETEDAIEVLTGGPVQPLYPDVVALLEDALDLEHDALATRPPKRRNDLLQRASVLKEDARAMMVEEQSAIAMGRAR